MGEKLGPYKIVRPLAIGGQAEIMLGELTGPGGFVIQHALKVLKVPLDGQNPLDLPEGRSLIAEARLLAQLSHPHTLAIHGLHVFDDRLVMVMEYVAGRSLGVAARSLRVAFSVSMSTEPLNVQPSSRTTRGARISPLTLPEGLTLYVEPRDDSE